MVDVVTQINIQAPLKRVADYSCNPDNAPEWYVNIYSVEWKTPKPLVPGSRIAFKAKFLRRELSYTYEVIEFSETKFVMRTSEGPFPMETSYQFEYIEEDITRVTLRNSGNPTGFSKLMTPLMRYMMKKANRKDLIKLKEIMESKA